MFHLEFLINIFTHFAGVKVEAKSCVEVADILFAICKFTAAFHFGKLKLLFFRKKVSLAAARDNWHGDDNMTLTRIINQQS